MKRLVPKPVTLIRATLMDGIFFWPLVVVDLVQVHSWSREVEGALSGLGSQLASGANVSSQEKIFYSRKLPQK